MAEAAARDVAFRNKEIDTSILGPAQYEAYRADPQLRRTSSKWPRCTPARWRFNPDSIKPFKDKRVRQAINYAIDANLIISRLVKDKAYRATSWLPLSSPAFDKTMKPYAYDPEKAKKLLAEAGYPERLRVRMDDQPERKLGRADRRGGDPDAGQGRHQGEAQAGRGHGADRDR